MNICKTMTDDELVSRYEQGIDSAFDVLLERHQDKLFKYIFFLVNDKDVANDIFQETFVRAITSIRSHRYTGSGYFYAWLVRIAHNLVHDLFHQNSQVPIISHEYVNEQSDERVDIFNDIRMSEPTIESVMLQQQSFEDVHLMMSYLPENQQEIVKMRFFQGLSYKEIAEELDVSINTALGRVRYALINLRKMAVKKDFYLSV